MNDDSGLRCCEEASRVVDIYWDGCLVRVPLGKLGNGVFKGLAMRIRVNPERLTGTKMPAFVSELKALPQLHFL